MNNQKLKSESVCSVEFNEEVEGTYVVSVNVKDTNFDVNCQTGTDHNYKNTNKLSCINESGGDYHDSGLAEFIESEELEHLEEDIKSAIEACAQVHHKSETVGEYLNRKTGLELSFIKGLAGACYAQDCSLNRYDAESGEVAIVDEDSSLNVADEIVLNYRVFDDEQSYTAWFDEATESHQGNWSGDCGLAYMLHEAL